MRVKRGRGREVEGRDTHTCEKEEGKDHDEGVSEVEQRRHEALDVQFAHVVVHTVDEEVDRCEARGQERPPPPVVVLGK